MVAVPEQFPPRSPGDRFPGRERAADPRDAAQESQAPLYRRDGRRQGLRQDRRDRKPAGESRPAAGRRRHDLHVSQGPGKSRRQEQGRGRQARRGDSALAIWPATSWSCRSTTWSRPVPRPAPRPRSSPARRSPTAGSAWTSDPATIAAYSTIIKEAGTVIWNGPMGKFEVEAFARAPGRSPRPWPLQRP